MGLTISYDEDSPLKDAASTRFTPLRHLVFPYVVISSAARNLISASRQSPGSSRHSLPTVKLGEIRLSFFLHPAQQAQDNLCRAIRRGLG